MFKTKSKSKRQKRNRSDSLSKVDNEDHLKRKSRQKKYIESLKSHYTGGQFRILNQDLYTSSSSDSWDTFSGNPKLFSTYHVGYSTQVKKWKIHPLDKIIIWAKKQPKDWVFVDMGCGEGRFGISISQKVHSFDLVSTAPHITPCNISKVPLKDETVDCVIFSLSLMGTDWPEFISEAHRMLKPNGILCIAEVSSRLSSIKDFIRGVYTLGFSIQWRDVSDSHFVLFRFKKGPKKKQKCDASLLKPCIYKRR